MGKNIKKARARGASSRQPKRRRSRPDRTRVAAGEENGLAPVSKTVAFSRGLLLRRRNGRERETEAGRWHRFLRPRRINQPTRTISGSFLARGGVGTRLLGAVVAETEDARKTRRQPCDATTDRQKNKGKRALSSARHRRSNSANENAEKQKDPFAYPVKRPTKSENLKKKRKNLSSGQEIRHPIDDAAEQHGVTVKGNVDDHRTHSGANSKKLEFRPFARHRR